MSEGGLTRRRGAGASAARTSGDDLDNGASGGGSGSHNESSARNTPSTPSTQGAVEGRSRIAYDPRDFNDDNESKQQPRLTLMEEVLLLGLKDKAVGVA